MAKWFLQVVFVFGILFSICESFQQLKLNHQKQHHHCQQEQYYPSVISSSHRNKNHRAVEVLTPSFTAPKTTINTRLCMVSRSSRNNNNNRYNSSSTSDEYYYDDDKELRPTTSFGAEAVPEGQRPVNEYLDVTSSPLFDWASINGSKGLLSRLVFLYQCTFWLICYPISGATYTMDGYMLQKLCASNVGAILVVLILLLRLYSGWYYIGQRLTNNIIEYEETGWYDGSYEVKTEIEMKRDRFLYNTSVKPVVDRLQVFFTSCVGITVGSIIAFHVANTANPIPFDQYDPNVLERLRADDDLAIKAASYTGGKPAYCDNRYYQAIANGGQGCN